MYHQRCGPVFEPGVTGTDDAPLDVAHGRELRLAAEFGRVGGEVTLQKGGDVPAFEYQDAQVVQQDNTARVTRCK